ncbi:MAG: hypothetical protein IKJ76_04490 [Fibrobacter sp.]|nr:hypothetical protein [Fibrobacter sp.]
MALVHKCFAVKTFLGQNRFRREPFFEAESLAPLCVITYIICKAFLKSMNFKGISMNKLSLLFVMLLLVGCSGGSRLAINNYDGTRYPKTKSCNAKVFHSQYWFEKWLNDEYDSTKYVLVGSTNWTSKSGFREKHVVKTCKVLGGDMAILLDEGVKYIDSYNTTFTTYSTKSINTQYRDNTDYYSSNNRHVGHSRTTGNIKTTYQEPEYTEVHRTVSYSGYTMLLFKER